MIFFSYIVCALRKKNRSRVRKSVILRRKNATKVVFALIQLGILANNLEDDEIRYCRTGTLSTKKWRIRNTCDKRARPVVPSGLYLKVKNNWSRDVFRCNWAIQCSLIAMNIHGKQVVHWKVYLIKGEFLYAKKWPVSQRYGSADPDSDEKCHGSASVVISERDLLFLKNCSAHP